MDVFQGKSYLSVMTYSVVTGCYRCKSLQRAGYCNWLMCNGLMVVERTENGFELNSLKSGLIFKASIKQFILSGKDISSSDIFIHNLVDRAAIIDVYFSNSFY